MTLPQTQTCFLFWELCEASILVSSPCYSNSLRLLTLFQQCKHFERATGGEPLHHLWATIQKGKFLVSLAWVELDGT